MCSLQIEKEWAYYLPLSSQTATMTWKGPGRTTKAKVSPVPPMKCGQGLPAIQFTQVGARKSGTSAVMMTTPSLSDPSRIHKSGKKALRESVESLLAGLF